MSYKHFFPFKSIIYLILNLYNLIVSNGCFQQPAYKIPKNVTVCFCRPMRADSSIPLLMLYHLLGSRGFLSQFKLCHAFVYLYNFSLYKLTFLRMPVWLSHFFFFFRTSTSGASTKKLTTLHPEIIEFLVRQL